MAVQKIKISPVNIKTREKLDFKAGDTIKVWSKIVDEKGKSRLQAFEGIVLARKHGKEIGATFTVRKVASGVGVERIFPLFSPMIDKIEITKKAKARRSKLYYIRTKAVKDVRRKMRSVTMQEKDKKLEDSEEETETETEVNAEVEAENKEE